MNATASYRFELTIESEELRFHHLVQVDTVFIHDGLVVHMVDQATHFLAALYLCNQSMKDIWNKRKCM